MTHFGDLKQRADERWSELVAGDRPWVRIGAAMCGHSAGALDVLEAVEAELDSGGIDANVDTVGCIGLCYAEPLVDVLKPAAPGYSSSASRPATCPGS